MLQRKCFFYSVSRKTPISSFKWINLNATSPYFARIAPFAPSRHASRRQPPAPPCPLAALPPGQGAGRGGERMALAQGCACPCGSARRARAGCESIPFGARKVWFCRPKAYLLPCKTIPPAPPPARRQPSLVPSGAPWPRAAPRQKAAQRPMKRGKTAFHTPSATLLDGAPALGAPFLRLAHGARAAPSRKRQAGAAHGRAGGRKEAAYTSAQPMREASAAGAEERWNGLFWPRRLSPPLIPEGAGARGKWLGAWGIGPWRSAVRARPRRQAPSLWPLRPCGRRRGMPRRAAQGEGNEKGGRHRLARYRPPGHINIKNLC